MMGEAVTIGSIIVGLGAIGGVIWTFVEIKDKFKKGLQEDLESQIKNQDSKITLLEQQIRSIEEMVNKDIIHLKESHSNEIKNLSEKIEELRDEVRNQHSQLVQLLSKLVSR